MIEQLRERFDKAASIIRRHKSVHLFTHYDADGISSACILVHALDRLGIGHDLTIFPTLEDKQMSCIADSGSDCMVLTDMGTGYLSELGALDRDCVIIDHHEPHTDTDLAHVAFINCHNVGYDGSFDVSASGLTYLFAQVLGDNMDLVKFAVAGMIGDKQHVGGFRDPNRSIVDSAVKGGHLIPHDRSFIPSGDPRLSLYECINPFIVGISGNAEGVESLLGLCESEGRDMEDEIEAILVRNGVPSPIIDECRLPRYYIPEYAMDVERFSRIIDACGRSGKREEVFAFCKGGDRAGAESVYDGFTKKLVQCASNIIDGKLVTMENIRYFINDVSGVTGAVAEICSKYLDDPIFPVIGIQHQDSSFSLSSRCTNLALEKGINMADAMKQSAIAVGGNGGGHSNAAGGSIPKERLTEFLTILDRNVGQQKRGHRPSHRIT